MEKNFIEVAVCPRCKRTMVEKVWFNGIDYEACMFCYWIAHTVVSVKYEKKVECTSCKSLISEEAFDLGNGVCTHCKVLGEKESIRIVEREIELALDLVDESKEKWKNSKIPMQVTLWKKEVI